MTTHELIEQHYQEHRDKLVKVLSNRAGGDYNAEDVIQDASERAIRYQGSFDPETQEFGAWFNTILNNALRDFKMEERRMGMGGAKDVIFGGRCDLEEGLTLSTELEGMSADTIKAVKKSIEGCEMPLRQVLYLYFFRQYKPREIAQVVDVNNGTIRQWILRFKNKMAERYGE